MPRGVADTAHEVSTETPAHDRVWWGCARCGGDARSKPSESRRGGNARGVGSVSGVTWPAIREDKTKRSSAAGACTAALGQASHGELMRGVHHIHHDCRRVDSHHLAPGSGAAGYFIQQPQPRRRGTPGSRYLRWSSCWSVSRTIAP